MPGWSAVANWVAHVNGVNPSPAMRVWLTDRASLTAKLIARSEQFRVRRLAQRRAVCLFDECAPIGLPQPRKVLERDVFLQCDGRPMVFAHTVVPLAATAAQWPLFRRLGERSLGTTLFGDPIVARGALEYARLHAAHPLVQRACAALGGAPQALSAPLFARRCLYRRRGAALLVTELFLPAIAALRVK
ncbi:chorismate lyase [Herminiimonas sp. CN]|uniref:chorismate--pyruvate lyase family protein n=1 Tax=Herminiimonas sp. CN TaxID=1349818 RepID=UPI000473DCC1|nr:chorismate lyase [Herminiimonas sp. CN]